VIAVRSLLFNLYFFLWTALILLSAWVLLPFPRTAQQWVVTMWGKGKRLGLKVFVGIGWQVRGRENIPDGPAIIASKHQSAWDTSIFHGVLSDPVYVLKKELTSIPFWGWSARKCEALVVDRAGGASALKELVRGTRASIEKGRQVIIFPEGTRTVPGQRNPYFPGIAAMYAQAKAPVVPVAVNSGLFWGRRSFVKNSGVITIEFLPPIPPGLDRRAFMAELEERIEAASERLRMEAEEKFPAIR
jgi:1-acyl-sn-glycerol-3-phosphate acyltransferase